MREALVYRKLNENFVECGICQRRCVLKEGNLGYCLTKINIKGKLRAINYGLIHDIQIDPIEKKPFYHFRPGELVPSIGSFGCNFHCKQCLNSWCSWGEHAERILMKAKEYPHYQIADPKKLINEIIKSGYHGIAFTYNEPVIWSEFILDTAKLAKTKKLFTLFVTNGSWTKETLDKIGPYIDAVNIDFKGFSENTYNKMGGLFKGILDSAKYAKEKYGIFLEITTLVIPGINDSVRELNAMARWIVKNLDAKTPWHLSRFEPLLAPDRQFKKIPSTPIESLRKIAVNGRKAGLEFVYIWAPGESLKDTYNEGNTYCPKCKKLMIQRSEWRPEIVGVDKKGNCSFCGENINVAFS